MTSSANACLSLYVQIELALLFFLPRLSQTRTWSYRNFRLSVLSVVRNMRMSQSCTKESKSKQEETIWPWWTLDLRVVYECCIYAILMIKHAFTRRPWNRSLIYDAGMGWIGSILVMNITGEVFLLTFTRKMTQLLRPFSGAPIKSRFSCFFDERGHELIPKP